MVFGAVASSAASQFAFKTRVFAVASSAAAVTWLFAMASSTAAMASSTATTTMTVFCSDDAFWMIVANAFKSDSSLDQAIKEAYDRYVVSEGQWRKI